LSRVPLRLRLTAAFAVAMGAVLAVAGVLLYQHVTRTLDRTLDDGLQARAADVAALVTQSETGLRESPVRAGIDTGFAQVLDTGGHVVDQTPGLGPAPLLRSDQLQRARRGVVQIDRASLAGESVRLRAEPVAAQGQQLVVVVGAPLETRDHALATLRTALLVGAPIALALASLLGYLLAAAALRPVERMRARAASISASRLSERLPVAASNDEVSRLGETLNEMLARLETALERERSFVADASHELRTPLAHLRAEVELALESPRDREELEEALRSVGAETDRLSQLAADLLLLARLDKGTFPIRRDDVALGDLLEGVATRFRRRASETGRTIETKADGQAHVDRLRIEQALGNLIENSLRHGAGTIRLAAVQQDGTLELTVTDEGPGFAPGFAPNAFERFSRAEQSRSTGGAGLGLAIVAAVASAHGGTARIAERAGGAAVSLSIPV
jgi:heavy metal sensor kinase